MRILFTLTLFLSSALLFVVQPMVAKMILPRFGGSPAVWTVSMLFFQALLLAGYAYAHASIRKLGAKKQALLHAGVLVAGLAGVALFLRMADGLRAGHTGLTSGAANPVLMVLGVLGMLIGPLFFIVSSGAPIIQRWFGDTDDPAAKDPYFLYSASNLGSMLALIAYPFLVEPALALGQQARLWSAGYGGLVLLMLACIAISRKRMRGSEETEAASEPITARTRLSWLALSAIPSSLLLGATNYLTTNVAPMPLLWIVPLSLYLLTFIVAFAKRQFVSAAVWGRLLPMLATPLAVVMILEAKEPMGVLAAIHLIAFVAAALMCHTRLAESRPPVGRLTEFYLILSVGGVLGGIFNAIVAPVIFRTLAEYPIALVLACFMRPVKVPRFAAIKTDLAFALGMLGLVVALVFGVKAAGMPMSGLRTGLVVGVPAIVCFLMVDRPARFALMLGALFIGSSVMNTSSSGVVIDTARSFFGVHRVLLNTNYNMHELVHGTTTHGVQSLDHPRLPLTYYGYSSPIGEIFRGYGNTPLMDHVALVGEGAGTLAAYGRPGQRLTFFEIDPVVDRIARDPEYFTFIRDSGGTVDTVLGDARLTLLAQPDGSYGLIALDAFSSDAIPIHLMTREAVEMYLRKLRPGGFMTFHISNRYLDLAPTLARVAQSLGLKAYLQEGVPSEDQIEQGELATRWVGIARRDEDVQLLMKKYGWYEIEPEEDTPLWTDDYSNILSAFKRDE